MNVKLSLTPAATSANGIAAAIAYSGGGYALTTTTMSDSLAHIITIGGLAATDHSGKTFTITGTDADDNPQTEGIAGPNGVATVSSTYHYKTVTSVTVSATTGADTFNLGYTAVAVSKTIPTNWRANAVEISLGLIITGTISVTVQHTLDAINVVDENNVSTTADYFAWLPHSVLATTSASADGNYAFPITATRLLVNSVTATATVAFSVVQANNA